VENCRIFETSKSNLAIQESEWMGDFARANPCRDSGASVRFLDSGSKTEG